jgi:hypothetical protein
LEFRFELELELWFALELELRFEPWFEPWFALEFELWFLDEFELWRELWLGLGLPDCPARALRVCARRLLRDSRVVVRSRTVVTVATVPSARSTPARVSRSRSLCIEATCLAVMVFCDTVVARAGSACQRANGSNIEPTAMPTVPIAVT